MEKVTLRRFCAEDINQVSELINKTIDICYTGVYPGEAVEYFKEYHTVENIFNDAARGYAVVLEREEILVGTGTLLNTTVKRVFIDPCCQHKGFGRLTMKELEKKAREEGVVALDLSASLVAKKFYDSLGYETVKAGYLPVKNGEKLHFYEMVKLF